jgi:phospholipid/cholesterol/gamma-HCH transport system substrate-binding protein
MKRHSEFSAGIFLMLAVLLFIASIWLIGQQRKIFSRQVEYFTTFRDVKGLAEGAPVRLGGITIGRVTNIFFTKDPSNPNIELTLLVDHSFMARIKQDSVVTLETQGLLGDRFLSISTGTNVEPLPAGSVIAHKEAPDFGDVLEKAGRAVSTTVEIAQNVNDLTRAAKNFADITDEVKGGDGLVHRLVYHKEEGERIIANLESTSDSINKIVESIRSGRGVLHALIYDRRGAESVRAITAAARNTAITAKNLSEIAEQVKSGGGLVHELIYAKSQPKLEDTLRKLNETAVNLEQASAALANGSGTLGALLVDSQLYDNLVEVTDGAKRSFILRQAIRSSMPEKDGEKPSK